MGSQPANDKFNLAAVGDGKIGGPGSNVILHNVVINKPTASSVVTIYDGTSTTGTKVATIDASQAAVGTLNYDCVCKNGIYAVMTAANSDVTITAGGL